MTVGLEPPPPTPSARTHTSGVCNRSPGECSQMNSKPGARHVRACLALPLDWISPRSVREGRRRSIRRLVIAGELKWGVNAETGRSPTEAAVVQLPSSASAQGRVSAMQLQPPASRSPTPLPVVRVFVQSMLREQMPFQFLKNC